MCKHLENVYSISKETITTICMDFCNIGKHIHRLFVIVIITTTCSASSLIDNHHFVTNLIICNSYTPTQRETTNLTQRQNKYGCMTRLYRYLLFTTIT